MTLDEFKLWAGDFATLMPQSGEWMKRLPQETLEAWYRDIFAYLQIQDAMRATKRLFHEGIEAYRRESIPALIDQYAREIAFQRTEAASAEQNKEEALQRVRTKNQATPTTVDAFREAMRARAENPDISKEELRKLINNICDESVESNG
jgi:alkylated DNA nucleotide flippase Atl1